MGKQWKQWQTLFFCSPTSSAAPDSYLQEAATVGWAEKDLEGVPGLPGAPQDEAGLTRKFETSHVVFLELRRDSRKVRV